MCSWHESNDICESPERKYKSMTLDQLEIGKDAIIEKVGGVGELRRHFLDMGLTPGTEITLMKKAPMGDPIELQLRGYF